jgi:hypothetical protein
VELSQAEVDAFIAAEKRVVGSSMDWEWQGDERARWSSAVEVDAVRRGEVWLIANALIPRSWHFSLCLHKTTVLRLEDQPPPARHQNRGCPEGFPARIGAIPHEHVWIDGCNLNCVQPREDLLGEDHRAFFQAFCERANLVFAADYRPPEPPEIRMNLAT